MHDNPNKIKLAIIYNPNAKLSPSNDKAIEKFKYIAESMNLIVSVFTKDQWINSFDYDIVFLRETTSINDITYKLASVLDAVNKIIIDDPNSIEICCNKITQFDLFKSNNIPIPRTFVIDKNSIGLPVGKINRPYIVKNPYSCFSLGVYKVDAPAEYDRFCKILFEKLDRLIVQEFIKTEFDWRIGLIGGEIIYACKYYMAHGHWKIFKHDSKGRLFDGDSQCIAIDEIPIIIKETAIKAASLVGNGLYGIDIKQIDDNTVYVIEINDNPSIDAGVEDEIEGDLLYKKIIQYFVSQYYQKKILD